MDTLLAEDVLLLLVDETTGKPRTRQGLDMVVGGALLSELALGGTVAVEDRGLRRTRVTAPGPRPADPLLDTAGARVAAKQRSPQSLVHQLGRELRPQLLERLAARGVLRCEKEKVLGLFWRTRWPAIETSHRAGLRRRLHAVLVTGSSVDERTGALVGLLSAVDQAHQVIDTGGDGRAVRRRAKEIAQGDFAPEAVRSALNAANAAVAAAAGAAAAGGAAGGA